MTSLIDRKIGKYKLIELLGSGGMAQVYRAIQFPLERSVAIKILHPYLTEEFRERFLREAKAVASLRHPSIVQIYDYDLTDGFCYMAMEFLEGLSLEERLKEMAEVTGQPTPLPWAEVLTIVIRVAEALDFAHRQGVVHRDVKPANIMHTADGRVVLTDFGIATVLHEARQTVEGGTIGTPAYMSPEQALGERGDERSDIYSLGAVLYQLVTGQLPFEADTLYGLIMKHVTESPPPASQVNPQVPLPVEQVICKAMAKAPADRYQTAEALAADLQHILAGESVDIKLPAGPQADPTQTLVLPDNRRHKFWWLAGAGALLVLLVVARVLSNQSAVVSPGGGLSARPADQDGVSSMAASNPARSADLFEEFNDNELDWLTSAGPISRQLVDGTYQVMVQVPDRAIAAYPQRGGVYDDFTYEAEAVLLEGQPESGYGLVFRRQDDDNYYVFAVNGLRQWSVWRLQNKAWRELRNLPGGQTWTDSEAVLAAGQLNRLKVEAIGPYLHFFVNDQPLLTRNLDDETFAGGGIGFYVATSRTSVAALARVQFDKVKLTPIKSEGIHSMTEK